MFHFSQVKEAFLKKFVLLFSAQMSQDVPKPLRLWFYMYDQIFRNESFLEESVSLFPVSIGFLNIKDLPTLLVSQVKKLLKQRPNSWTKQHFETFERIFPSYFVFRVFLDSEGQAKWTLLN